MFFLIILPLSVIWFVNICWFVELCVQLKNTVYNQLWKVLVTQSHPSFCDTINCSLPGISAHGILQTKILEWISMPFSMGSSWSKDSAQVSYIAGQSFTFWATREALQLKKKKSWNERNWKVNLLMRGKAVCRVEWDWQGAEEKLLIWHPFGLGILLLFYYSKSPTYEPFIYKLSKMWMCICMSNHLS